MKEKAFGIKAFGWFLIILSFIYLIAFPKIISSYYKLISLAVGLPESIDFLAKLSIYSIISTLVVFFLFFITGIGILKMKRWAYYIALLIPFMYFIGIIKNIWFFGPQYIMRLPTLSALFVSIIIALFLVRKNIIKQFNADYITKRGMKLNPRKFIFWSSIALILANVIPLTSWILLVKVKHKENVPIINLKPQKIEYQIKDKIFIFNNCEKRNVFDYSIYIPKNWKIGMITKGDSGFGWSLNFLDMEGPVLKAFIVLDSKGFGKLLLPISKALNFNTAYDFEKKINYPSWAPIYLILKTVGNPNSLEGIDEATTPTWRGFIKAIKSKEKNIYEGSLYSLKGDKTCGVTVFFKNEAMASEQAKSIIASLEFKTTDGISEHLFEKGKMDLSNADFTSAAINFMNALYVNERNPEYAYYLARSLFEDSSVAGRKSRLSSSRRFLEYTLKLNSSHQEAKELLVSIDSEIKKVEEK